MLIVSPSWIKVSVKIDRSIIPPEAKSPSEEGPVWLVLRRFLDCQL